MKTIKQNKNLLTFIIILFFIPFMGRSINNKKALSIKPNIIYINADDLGVMDVGFNSNRYNTPNIDQLRAEGMLFTNAYAPASNCAPSRACVLSGQYGPRHGVYTVKSSSRGKAIDRKLIPIENTRFLSKENTTMAEVLRNGGYKTVHLGKWHISANPLQHGFDINIGGDDAPGPAKGGYYSPFSRGAMKKLNAEYPERIHRVDVFAEKAIQFMKANKANPFFVHMSYYSVHSRLEPVDEFIEKYKDKDVNANYASMIEKMDQGIGKILKAIETMGLRENTIVLFCSDNGAVIETSNQKPYRAGKGSYFEGGIREPLIVRWPHKIDAGSICDVPVSGVDFYPTFLDLANIKVPEGKILDGVSLKPLLLGKGSISKRSLFWHFPIYLQASSKTVTETHDTKFRTRPGSALRQGKWKLHEYFEDGRLELYNLETDLGERNNLAKIESKKTAELHEILKQWRANINAPVPTEHNPQYQPK